MRSPASQLGANVNTHGPAAALQRWLAPAERWIARTNALLRRPEALRWSTCATFVAIVVLYYPGFMSVDSYAQLSQARSGVFSDSHPPLMGLIWGVVDAVISGPFGMLVLQCALVVVGLSLIVARLKLQHDACAPLLVPAVLLFPPVLTVLGVIWKDTLLAGFLLLGFGLALQARSATGRRTRSMLTIGALLAAVAATGVRPNSVAAAFGLVWFLLDRSSFAKPSRRRLWASGAFALVLALGLFGIVSAFNSRVATVKEAHWQHLVWFDLAGTSVYANELAFSLAPAPEGLGGFLNDPHLSLAGLRHAYSAYYVGTLFQEPSAVLHKSMAADDLEALATAWRAAIVAHPAAYLKHRWSVMRFALRQKDGGAWAAVYMQPTEDPAQGIALHHDYVLSRVQRAAEAWLTYLAEATPWFVPFYYLIAACLLLVLAVRWRSPETHVAFFLLTSGLCYEATLLVGAAS